MIISASYKTDIPAFYGQWFRKRMEAEYCKMKNPYGGQVYTVPLDPRSVDAFVFWTRDAAPFWDNLEWLKARGYPFMIQYTVTGYPRDLEGTVPDAGHALVQTRRLCKIFGPRAVVWRYDPILISTLTPAAFHLENFSGLCGRLRGAVDEVVVSFVQPYAKTCRNLGKIGGGFSWHDAAEAEKSGLLAGLARLAGKSGMKFSLCAQRGLLAKGGADASCIDIVRLSEIAGREIKAAGKGHRPGCGCAPSKDIGTYDTCPFGCAYCYANPSPGYASSRREEHDPEAEML